MDFHGTSSATISITRAVPWNSMQFLGTRSAPISDPDPRWHELTHLVRNEIVAISDDIFKCIFLSANVLNSIKISLTFIFKGPIHNILALVQIMDWCWPGDKPLSEPMNIILLTHICVTRPQWVKWEKCITYALGHSLSLKTDCGYIYIVQVHIAVINSQQYNVRLQ